VRRDAARIPADDGTDHMTSRDGSVNLGQDGRALVFRLY
jgi:hypothetical protein